MVGDKFTVPLARENYDRYEKLPRFSEKLDAKAAEKVKVKAMAENPDGTLTEVELPDDVGPPRLELLKDEIKIEVEVLSSGNVSATLIRPYDTKNNKKIEDGRIEVRDQFIFDPMMNTLLRDEANELRCHHTVKWNQRGIDKQGWLTREKMMDSVRQAPDKVVEDIALNVVRAFPRPFLKEHRQYLNEHLDFNLPVIERAAKLGLIIDTTHPGTHYSIVRPGGVIEMIFSYAYRKEGIPGYLVVQDTFTQGGFGFHCRREAKPGRGFENNEDWRNLAEQLNPLPQPDPGAATRFMRDYLKEGEFRGKLFELSLYKIASPSTDKPPLEAPQEIVIQDFHQVMEDRIVEEQAIPLAEISPEFFQALEDNKVHFQPLQEALGPEFSIDFRNPELAVTTRFENGKTCIYFKFSIRSQEENGPKGVVEYRERWIYNEQGWLEAINPSVRSYGTEADSSLDLAGQRIRAAITEGKFRQPESAADFTSLALLLPFVAPHLSYAGYLKNLDRKDAEILGETSSKMPIVERKIRTQLFREPFEILEKIQKELLPLLQQEESENFSFRFGLARALAALQHYDQRSRRPFLAPALRELEQIKKIENENYENATQAVQDVEKIRDQALRAKKRLAALEEKNRCFDRRQLIEMIAAIAKRDMKKAEIHMQALHSPALKRVCQEPIEAFLRKEKAVEDFEILRVIEKDRIARRSHESKRLIGGGPSVDVEAENQRLESVLAKASNYARIYGAKDSLATLREAADFLQDSQSRALTQLESELKMTAEERSFALRLGEDKLMSHVLSIAGRRDKGQKASELFLFVKTQLYDKGLPNAAKWLTAQISRHYLPKSRALESLQVIRQISSEQIAKKHAQKLADLTEAMPQSGVNVDFDSLIKKLGAQAQKNPKLDVAALLKSLDALQGKEKLSDAEKKIRDEILAFPLIQALNAAAQLSDVEQRFQLYWNEILQGLPIQSQQDPRLLRDLQTRLGAIAQVAATTEAPAVEGAAIIAMRYNSYFVRKQEEAEAFVLDGLQKKMAAALAPENQKNLQKDPLLVLDEILPIPESEREVDLLRKKIINTFDGLGLRQKIADAAAISTLPERMEAYRKLASDLILELNSLLKQLQQEPLRDIQGYLRKINEYIAALEQKTHAETPALDAWQMVQFLYPIAVKVENNRAIKEAQLRAEEEMEHLESLFKKASSLALTHSDENALALFRELLETKKEDYALSSEERVLAEQFTGDSVLQKFAEVADDATTAGRKKKYFDLLGVQWSAELSQWVIAAPTAGKDSKSEETKPPLLFEAGLTASLEVLWNLLNKNQLIDPDNAELEIPEDELSKNPFREYLVGRKKELIDDVEQFLRLSEGNERLGTSIAYGLPHLLDEWSKPTSIAAVATGLGVGYRVGMAIGARCGLTWWGGLAATAGEIVADGTLFTLTQKAGESALYSYEGQWLDAEGHFIVHKDLFANVLLSGLNRGGSVLVSQGSTRLAASKLGQVLGFGRPVAGSAEVIRTMAPNGRIVLVGNPAASGVPQLTPWGELVTAGFHHAGSFGLMYGGGKLVYKMGLSSEDPTVTKVGLMYVHGLTTGPIFHGTTAARAAAQREDLSQRRKALKAEKKAAKKNSTHQENLFGEANFHASPFWTRVGGMYLYGMMPGGSRGTALPHIDAWPEVIPNPKQNAKKSPPTPVSVFQGPDFDNLSFSSPAGKRVVSLEQPENREISILHQLANLSIRRPLNEEALKASDAKIDQFIEKVGDITLTRQEDGKILLHNSRDDVVQPTREDSNPSLLRTPLLRNGKQVLCDETVELKSGDVLKMGNVEIRVDAGITPLRKNFRRMQIPPEQQVVIANALSRAKNIPKLEEELQNVGGRAAAGAAEVLDLAQQVFSGKLPLEHLPQELNIRGSVQNLLEAEVARLRQEHPEVQAAAFELKDGPLHRDLSPLEMEFHRLREMRGFKARVQNAKDIPEFVEALGRPFAKIAGVEVEAQLQGLNRELLETAHRHIKSKVEEAEKNVRLLEEDYQKRESHSRKNPQAASDHGKEVAELKTSEAVLNQCRRDLELLKEQEHALEQRLQQTQSGSASAAGKVDLADFPIPLPVVRQKARDLHEQAEGRFAAGLDLQDKSALTALAKKYHFDSGNADDFNGIQSMIRLCFDDAGPSARAFLSRASSKDIDLLFKVYFGEAQERLLPAAKAQQLAFLFGQAGIKESLGLSLNNLEGDGRSLTLRRGNFEEQVKNIPDEALVFRTYPAAEQGKSPVVRTEEIEALIHQAQQFQSRIDSQAQQFQSQRDIKTMKMFHGQMKGSSLFFNPVKGVFEAWSLRPECLIKIEVTLTDSNEVVDVRVKYAPQPGRSGKKAELEDDNFIQRQNDDGSLELGTVALQEIGLKDLTKELPFPILQTSSWEKVGDARARSFDLLARGARRAGRGTAHAASYAAQAVGKVVDKVRGKSP